MKKVLFPLLGLVLALGLAVPVAAHTEESPFVKDLIAGQHINVGTVKVWNDSTTLHVIYQTTGDWKITETHLAVATSLAGIPQTRTGNPKVDDFPYYAGPHSPVTTYTYIITHSWAAGTPLYIAAHAKVVDTSSMMTTTVVSEAGVVVYGPLGVYAGLDDAAWGTTPNPAVATWVHGGWPSIPGATWISSAYTVEDSESDSWRWFHDEITIPEKGYYVPGSMILATADNAEEFYFNGTLVGSDGEVQVDYNDNAEWNTKIQYPIAPQPGVNTLDFIVRNYAPYYPDKYGGHYAPNPTGLIYKAEVNYYPEESAWGSGDRFVERGNWATWFTYEVQ